MKRVWTHPTLLQSHENAHANAKSSLTPPHSRSPTHLVEQDIRARRALDPLDIIHVPRANQLTSQQLAARTRKGPHVRKAVRPHGLGPREGRHTAHVLVPQVAAGPRRGARRGGRQAREDVELRRARERRRRGAAVQHEVQLAGHSAGGARDVEGRQRRHVADAPVLEDLARARVEVDGAGPHAVLRDGGGHDNAGAAGDGGWGWDGGSEAQDGGGDGSGEELHFNVGWLVGFKRAGLRKFLGLCVDNVW